VRAARTTRRGATLIEVLAGLVILSTILSSAVIARGRFARQWRDAEDQIAAARVAESLVSRWTAQPPGSAPVPGEGAADQSDGLVWRSSWTNEPSAQRLGARVARLELFDVRRNSAGAPLVSVEFLLRVPAPATSWSQP
jgi:prepilin-type N-terminal cleavage/methylation domain-containing protein